MGDEATPSRANRSLDARIEECWDWVAVALFLLVTVDLLTTIFAAATVGVEHETNPLMVWLLTQPVYVLVGVHIGATVLVAAFFYALFEMVRTAPERFQGPMLRGTELYLGLLVAVGLLVFANNLSVIVLGGSLL